MKQYNFDDANLPKVSPNEELETISNNYFRPLFAVNKFEIRAKTLRDKVIYLSPNYFSDLIKKETEKSAQEYIQSKVIDVAKERIWDIDKSISEMRTNLVLNIHSIFRDRLSSVWVSH